MSTLLVLVLSLAAGGMAILSHWLLVEYVLPDRMLHDLAKYLNLPRGHHERRSIWSRRLFAALNELHEASDEFVVEATQLGNIVDYPNSRGGYFYLPEEHPAAVRYRRARGL